MKRLIKLAISLLVRGWDVYRSGMRRLGSLQTEGTCVVLYYHGIGPTERESFARQMDEMLRLATPVPAGLKDPLTAGGHHCAVTFDDGFVSVIENALPELERRNIPSTVFVPTGSMGGRPAWITESSHPAHNEIVIAPSQLAALKARESVTIGSHSVSHSNFLKLDEVRVGTELSESKAVLENVLGEPVRLFSFPHGKCDARLVQMAKSAGYERVFTIEPGFALRHADELVSSRVSVAVDDWPLEFRLKVLGAYRWMAKARA